MGIITFLKKIFQKPQLQVQRKILSINQVQSVISEIKDENLIQDRNFKDLLMKKLADFLSSIDQKRHMLETVDISKNKVEEKIKIIVQENLPHFLFHLDQLILGLKGIGMEKNTSLNDVFHNLAMKLDDFEKKSSRHYQKATVIIGKEMGDIHEAIIAFSRDIQEIFKKYRPIINKKEAIEEISKNLHDYLEIAVNFQKIKGSISKIQMQLSLIKEEIIDKEKELGEYKTSIPYQNFLKMQESILQQRKYYENEIQLLKGQLNLKYLLKLNHNNLKKSSLIKRWENPESAFESDQELKILEVLKDASRLIDAPQGISLISKERLDNIKNFKNTLNIKPDIRAEEYDRAIKRKYGEISTLERELKIELLREEKLASKKSVLFNEMAEKFKKLNIQISDG